MSNTKVFNIVETAEKLADELSTDTLLLKVSFIQNIIYLEVVTRRLIGKKRTKSIYNIHNKFQEKLGIPVYLVSTTTFELSPLKWNQKIYKFVKEKVFRKKYTRYYED